MSWLLRRWLNSSTEEKPNPIPSPASTTTAPATTAPATTPTATSLTTQNQHPQPTTSLVPNNLKLLLGGLVFFSISALVTRRSLIRKHTAGIPPFYTSTVYHKANVNGAFDAFEALNLATINVFAVGMTIAGGALCALDVHSAEDARARLRRRLLDNTEGGASTLVPPTSEEEEQFERDMEDWLENVMGKRNLEEVRRKVEAAKAAAKDDTEKRSS